MTPNLYGGYAFLSDIPGTSQTSRSPYETTNNAKKAIFTPNNGRLVQRATPSLGNSFTQEFGLIMVGALVFIVSFLWKDFLTDIEHVFISDNPSMTARFLYTMVVTIIVIFLIMIIRNYLNLSGRSRYFLPIDDLSGHDHGVGQGIGQGIGPGIGPDTGSGSPE